MYSSGSLSDSLFPGAGCWLAHCPPALAAAVGSFVASSAAVAPLLCPVVVVAGLCCPAFARLAPWLGVPIGSASTGRIPVDAAGLLAPGVSAAGLAASLPSDWLLVLDEWVLVERSARLAALLHLLLGLPVLAVLVLVPLSFACWALVSAAAMSIGCFFGWGLLPLRFLVTCLLHGAVAAVAAAG